MKKVLLFPSGITFCSQLVRLLCLFSQELLSVLHLQAYNKQGLFFVDSLFLTFLLSQSQQKVKFLIP
jgi:hypothetical protein